MTTPPPRRRRRAVGPPGAHRSEGAPGGEVLGAGLEAPQDAPSPAEDERLSADRPPHHDRGV